MPLAAKPAPKPIWLASAFLPSMSVPKRLSVTVAFWTPPLMYMPIADEPRDGVLGDLDVARRLALEVGDDRDAVAVAGAGEELGAVVVGADAVAEHLRAVRGAVDLDPEHVARDEVVLGGAGAADSVSGTR